MVRLKFHFDLQQNQYQWTVLDAKRLGVLQFETGRGRVVLPNYPHETQHVINMKPVSTFVTKNKHPLLQFVWGYVGTINVQSKSYAQLANLKEILNVYNPVTQKWMCCLFTDRDTYSNHIFDTIEYHIIEYVTNHSPDIHQSLAMATEDRKDVETVFTAIGQQIDTPPSEIRLDIPPEETLSVETQPETKSVPENPIVPLDVDDHTVEVYVINRQTGQRDREHPIRVHATALEPGRKSATRVGFREVIFLDEFELVRADSIQDLPPVKNEYTEIGHAQREIVPFNSRCF